MSNVKRNSVVDSVVIKPILLLALCLGMQSVFAGAQAAEPVPHVRADAQTMRVVEKAGRLFDERRYERAFFIYRNELATIGDKYSQYMVGFMYLTGKGVDRDKARAAAWYRLAAERGTPEFMQVSAELDAALNQEDMASSRHWFAKLRGEVGDLAVLMKAVRKDYETLRERTGSRLSSDASPVTVFEFRGPGGVQPSPGYYGRIEKRLETRLAYIAERTKIEIVDYNLDSIDLDAVEKAVDAHLAESD